MAFNEAMIAMGRAGCNLFISLGRMLSRAGEFKSVSREVLESDTESMQLGRGR
jgi:hypothetical protein